MKDRRPYYARFFDKPDNKSGAVTVLEGDGKDGSPTVESIMRWSKSVTDRLAELDALVASGRIVPQEEWDKVNEAQRQLAEKVHAVKLALDGARVPSGGHGFIPMNLRTDILRAQDKDSEFRDLDLVYHNLIACSPEELLGAADDATRVGMPESMSRGILSQDESSFARRLRRFQKLNDVLLIKDSILSFNPQGLYARRGTPTERMKTLREWKEYEALATEFSRALVEGSGAGANLVPVILSASIAEMVEAELRVAALFPRITMTSKTYEWPVQTSHLTWFLATESSGEAVGDAYAVAASTPGISKPVWTAVKLMGISILSSEITEDSLAPALPFIQGDMARGGGHAIEEAMINGERGATNMDGATFNPAGSARRAWSGLRYQALMTSSPAALDMGAVALTSDKTIDLQEAMGPHGARPGDLVHIVGFKAWHGMRKLSGYRTIDQIGNLAAVLRGQVGIFEGSPVVLSEKVTKMKTTGKFGDGTALTQGSLLTVNIRRFAIGDRRAIDVETSNQVRFLHDQIAVKGRLRMDFQPLDAPSATVAPVGIIFNIA
ncbi:MAG: hypothetical protein RI885_2270 [Actinomycetota bacterium]|jgi:HK97 family phage major capsid protein